MSYVGFRTKLFDPIGWLSPVVIKAKILIQDLLREGEDWDQKVSSRSQKTWCELRGQLKDVERILISRWLGSYATSTFELPCFCDASEKAYAAALYVVVHNEEKVHSKGWSCVEM